MAGPRACTVLGREHPMRTQDFYGTTQSRWRRALARAAATGAVAALAACQTTIAHERPTGRVFGRVNNDAAPGTPVVVFAFERGTGQVVHRVFLEKTAAFSMPLHSGSYKFYACADTNRDGRCGEGEARSALYSLTNEIQPGDLIQMPSFTLNRRARAIAAR
jgi:hypothetical protein